MIKIIPILLAVSFASTANSTITGTGKIGFSTPSRSGFVQDSGISSRPLISRSSKTSSSYGEMTDKDCFYSDKYGPFSSDDPEPVEMTFTYGFVSIDSQTIIERVRLFKSNSVVSASSKPSFSYTKGQIKEVTFNVNIRDYIDDKGIELRFEIVNSSRIVLRAYTANLFPPSKSRINATTLKQNVYVSRPLGFYGNGEEMCEIKEEIDFTSFGDYVDNDYYYRLDIGRNAFASTNSKIACSSARLFFDDFGYVFPNFPHSTNQNIELPLKMKQKNGIVSFAFIDKFYINKKTLDISYYYQPNYIVSSSFYLPINSLRKFNGKILFIEIKDLGMDQISFTYPLKYELNRLVVGACSNGEYCIHGGTY